MGIEEETGPSLATRVGIVAVVTVILVSLGVIFVHLTQRGQQPPTAQWALPSQDWAALPAAVLDSEYGPAQASPLNELAPPKLLGCPAPQQATSRESWEASVRAQWSCVHRSWEPLLEQLGMSTMDATVQFYAGGGTDSDCGYIEAPAFYCSVGSGTVYFGGEHFEMAKNWDLSVNEMVNHEYGHHLQKLAGITQVKVDAAGVAEPERRAELQATCWSAMMTYHNESVDFGAAALEGWTNRLNHMLEDSNHGRRASLVYWGTRGLYAATLGDCNTWVVEPHLVR